MLSNDPYSRDKLEGYLSEIDRYDDELASFKGQLGPTGSNTNIYHLDGLIAAATPFAAEEIERRAIERAAKIARARRKGPAKKLHVVKGGKT